MLGPGRYLQGVAELALLVGFAGLGAARLRERLLPRLEGAPAYLGTGVIALALLIWLAEILGTASLFKPVPYLVGMGVVGLGIWMLGRRASAAPRHSAPDPGTRRAGGVDWATLAALVLAAAAVVHFAAGVRVRLSTGMTGFDSTWYHGPFAAGFFQSGNTFDLHFIAPQFLAWFYPANGEIFHAVGMLAFGRDLLSPLLNLGWFLGCLLAAWCIGRPHRVAPWSLALGAIALSVPALSDQAGEARNDIVGIFFLLAAVAIALNAWAVRPDGEEGLSLGGLLLAGLAAGLAAGTKLNFLLPAAVLVVGLAGIAPPRTRWRALLALGLAALSGGGYWYLRNLIHTGNPLPWIHHLGPISLPAPEQGLGGREAHSVLSYLTDGSIWSNWFLPGLHHGLWILWPLLGAAALAGLILCLLSGMRMSAGYRSTDVPQKRPRALSQRSDLILSLAGLVGLASILAWLIAPTSASGPDGMPRGFESGLRYLAPALVLGLALLPVSPLLREKLAAIFPGTHLHPVSGAKVLLSDRSPVFGAWRVLAAALLGVVVAVGYPVQRHYLLNRYANPSFAAPGLDAAFKWAGPISGARIATTSTRQYPLYGTDLSNHVTYVGTELPHGGLKAPSNCRAWRRELDAGHYDYVIATRDRLEPGKPPYPPQATWTEGPGAAVILRKPPTVIFRLTAPLNPSSCPAEQR